VTNDAHNHNVRASIGTLSSGAIIAALLTGCASSAPSSSVPSASASPSPTPAATPTPDLTPAQFTSNRYGYRLRLPAGWTGGQAFRTWDGRGSPGYDSLPVDTFGGPRPITVWAYAGAYDGTLAEWVASTSHAAAMEHACPEKPETSASLMIGRERARLLGMHCPADGGIFVALAVTVHSGMGFVFAAQDPSGASTEAAIRSSLLALFERFQFLPG
jgi:hypothetical protein